MVDRLDARAQRLAVTHAIASLTGVEHRLEALLWHFADRWGRVTADGVLVSVPLSHRLLGELVGARRPTVSTALGLLEREGKVTRRSDATWVLHGDPPGTPAAAVARVVAHRRRLLRDQPEPLVAGWR